MLNSVRKGVGVRPFTVLICIFLIFLVCGPAWGQKKKITGASQKKIVKKTNIQSNLTKERPSAKKSIPAPRWEEKDDEDLIDLTHISYGKWKDHEERFRLVKVAKSFVGAPYKLGGDTVRGLDCSAFVRKVFEIFDVNLPRTARQQFLVGKRVEKEELSAGDLVFFRTRPTKDYPNHVGIYIGNGKFIHASSYHGRGVRIDSLDQPFYRRTYVGAVRIKDLPEEIKETKNAEYQDRNS